MENLEKLVKSYINWIRLKLKAAYNIFNLVNLE